MWLMIYILIFSKKIKRGDATFPLAGSRLTIWFFFILFYFSLFEMFFLFLNCSHEYSPRIIRDRSIQENSKNTQTPYYFDFYGLHELDIISSILILILNIN